MAELVAVREIVSVKNKKPSGFNIHIHKKELCIKKISKVDEFFGGLTLDAIFTDFTRQRKYLPPMVLAKSNKGIFHFLGFFAVRAKHFKNIEKHFKVYMKETWTGTDFTPEFLLDYSCSEADKDGGFVIFQVDFKMKFHVAPENITTYVWDEDPEGSRGTVTTVQSGDD